MDAVVLWDRLLALIAQKSRAAQTKAIKALNARPSKIWGVMGKAAKGAKLHPIDAQSNRTIAKAWARRVRPDRGSFRMSKYYSKCETLV